MTFTGQILYNLPRGGGKVDEVEHGCHEAKYVPDGQGECAAEPGGGERDPRDVDW